MYLNPPPPPLAAVAPLDPLNPQTPSRDGMPLGNLIDKVEHVVNAVRSLPAESVAVVQGRIQLAHQSEQERTVMSLRRTVGFLPGIRLPH